MYFQKFPLVAYKHFLDPDQASQVATNILKRVAFRKNIKESSFFVDYIVNEGESPESIAHDYYGETELHWVVLLFNNIINPYHDWPMDMNTLDSHIERKYPGKSFFVSLIEYGSGPGWSYGNPVFSEHLVRGKTIFKTTGETDGFGAYYHKEHVRGLIESWDPHLQKIVVTNVEGRDKFAENDVVAIRVKSGDSRDAFLRMKLHRLVDISSEALHHFEVETKRYTGASTSDTIGMTGDYVRLDPLSTAPPRNNMLGHTADEGSNEVKVKFYQTNLGTYMGITGDGSNSNDYAVSNRVYEERINEDKRRIKLLLPEYLSDVTDEFNTLLSEDTPFTLR